MFTPFCISDRRLTSPWVAMIFASRLLFHVGCSYYRCSSCSQVSQGLLFLLCISADWFWWWCWLGQFIVLHSYLPVEILMILCYLALESRRLLRSSRTSWFSLSQVRCSCVRLGLGYWGLVPNLDVWGEVMQCSHWPEVLAAPCCSNFVPHLSLTETAASFCSY